MSKLPELKLSADETDLSELVDLVPQPEKLEVGSFTQKIEIGQQQAEWTRSNGSFYLRSLDPQRGDEIEAAAEELYAIERSKVEYPEYSCISNERVRGQIVRKPSRAMLTELSIAGCAGYVVKLHRREHLVLTPVWLPMGYVLVSSRSEHKISTRRDRHQNRQLLLAIQKVVKSGIVVAVAGSVLYFVGFNPHETLKEAQLREFREAKDKAMDKKMDEELEAEMRAWQKTEQERALKPIQKAN